MRGSKDHSIAHGVWLTGNLAERFAEMPHNLALVKWHNVHYEMMWWGVQGVDECVERRETVLSRWYSWKWLSFRSDKEHFTEQSLVNLLIPFLILYVLLSAILWPLNIFDVTFVWLCIIYISSVRYSHAFCDRNCLETSWPIDQWLFLAASQQNCFVPWQAADCKTTRIMSSSQWRAD